MTSAAWWYLLGGAVAAAFMLERRRRATAAAPLPAHPRWTGRFVEDTPAGSEALEDEDPELWGSRRRYGRRRG